MFRAKISVATNGCACDICGRQPARGACRIDEPSKCLLEALDQIKEPAMSDNPRVSLLPVLGLLLAVLISPRFAYGQIDPGTDTWAVLDVSAALNRAIEESNGGVALREKVVPRSAECSL